MSPIPNLTEASSTDQLNVLKSQNEILWTILVEKGLVEIAIERGAFPPSENNAASILAASPSSTQSSLPSSKASSIKSQRSSNSVVSLNEEKKKIELSSPINFLPDFENLYSHRDTVNSPKDSLIYSVSSYAAVNDSIMPNCSFDKQPAIDPFASPADFIDEESRTDEIETNHVVTFLKCEWDWDEKGKEISRYFFSVKPPGKEGWIIAKKIKDFIELESLLKKTLSKADFEKWGKIGEKGLLNGSSPASRNVKKSALEFYLTHLLYNLSHNGIVIDFVNRNRVDESDILKTDNISSGSSSFIKEGFLIKKGSFFNPWIVRYYRLKNYRLDYYQTKYGPVYGSIKLQAMTVGSYHGFEHEFKHAFTLENQVQQFYLVLCAENDTERDEWIYHLKNVIQEAKTLSQNASSPRSLMFVTSISSPTTDYPTSHLRSDAESIYMIPQDESFPGRDSSLSFSQKSLFEKVFNSPSDYNLGNITFNIPANEPAKSSSTSSSELKMFGIPLQQSIKNSSLPYSSPEVLIPSIVHQCIEYLEKQQAFLEEGIFRLSGSSSSIKVLREKYDKEPSTFNLEGQEPDVHVISGLLKLYFRELPQNIILPNDAFLAQQPETPLAQLEQTKNILSSLPPENIATLRILFEYLRKVADNCAVNKMTVKNLAIVFSATLSVPSWLFLTIINESKQLFQENSNM